VPVIRITLEITNAQDAPLIVWFEPWADSIELKSNEAVEVECEALQPGTLPIEYRQNALVIFGLPGSRMRALRGENVLWECHQALP
jgi:hypothetical protein